MAKFVNDTVMDNGLNIYNGNTGSPSRLAITAGEQTTVANVTSNLLASAVIDGSDVTLADGTTSGRKNTIAAQTGMSITSTGTGDHLSVDDATTVFLVTTLSNPQVLTSGGTVDSTAFEHEIADVTP